MPPRSRAYPNTCLARLSVFAATVIAVGCGSTSQTLPIDLLRELSGAERRAAGPLEGPDAAIHLDIITAGGSTWPALVTQAPARVTWSLHLTGNHPMLKTAVLLLPEGDTTTALGATARIAIVGGRSYHELARVMPRSAWTPIEIDLSNYTGWRFSLFYQPYRMTWKIVFAADAAPHGRIAWAQPMIEGRP